METHEILGCISIGSFVVLLVHGICMMQMQDMQWKHERAIMTAIKTIESGDKLNEALKEQIKRLEEKIKH